MSDLSLSQVVQDCCQNALRTAVASRDSLLFAAAAHADEAMLRRFCCTLADQLGGQVAALSQLLVAHGCRPIAANDERMDRLRATLVATLEPPRPAPVEDPARAQPKTPSNKRARGPSTRVESPR